MARRVFYGFHYQPDCSRVSQVRNIGMIEANPAAHDNDWEQIKSGRDPAIQKWIDGQLTGRTCTVVMIGATTAGRKWIDYEIRQSWNSGMGVVGVRIHNLRNLQGHYSTKGSNPFDDTSVGDRRLSTIVKTYDPSGNDSKEVYAYIASHLPGWIDEAIEIRRAWR
jgi:hypothetical protein